MTRVVAHHVQHAGAHLLCNLSILFSCAVPHLEAEGDADGIEAQQAHAPRHIHHICARKHTSYSGRLDVEASMKACSKKSNSCFQRPHKLSRAAQQ